MVRRRARQLVVVQDDPLALPDVGVLPVVNLEHALDYDEGGTAQQGTLQPGGDAGVERRAEEGGNGGEEEGAAKGASVGGGVRGRRGRQRSHVLGLLVFVVSSGPSFPGEVAVAEDGRNPPLGRDGERGEDETG